LFQGIAHSTEQFSLLVAGKQTIGRKQNMKWIVIILVIALFGAGIYIVMTKGGVLEMQPEHAVEAPASHPTATVKK
jgi:hypothetical protein